MSGISKSASGAFVCLWSISALFTCAVPVLAETGWTLHQSANTGVALSGAMTLYITPTGMRAYEPKNGISLMTRGPNWTVYIYNEKTKRMFSSPLQTWLTSFKQRGMVGRFQGATWKRGNQNGAVAGVRAYEFVMDKPPPIRTTSKSLNGRMVRLNSLKSASLWVASDIATPPQVSNLLSNIYGVPDCQRIPLRVVLSETGRGQQNAVDTLSVNRVNVPDSTFAVPQGYMAAKSDTDVFIDKESMDTIDEMLNDLDSPTPARRRPSMPLRPGQRPVQQQRTWPGQQRR